MMNLASQSVMIRYLFVAFGLGSVTTSLVAADYGKIELVRDHWGTPHVFAETDPGAMYGLGYATAEDRGFQMTYSLRIIQGRLSEVLGIVQQTARRETSLDHDRKMRTFGFYQAAQQVARNLDQESRSLLQAYCDGVNDCLEKNSDQRMELFGKYELVHEPWTPADCLASWWHLGQFFATDGTRDLIALRNRGRNDPRQMVRQLRGERGGRGRRPVAMADDTQPFPPDDGPAVVKRIDVAPEWIEQTAQFAKDHGLTHEVTNGPAGPKFSHAWVVGKSRSTTGSSILVSDPQTPVRNPSIFYEFHVQGATFNARGIGVPGNPILLIGFTERVAWGVTALGADQADLFLLKTDSDHPDQYLFDDEWRPMKVRRETIQVRDRDPVDFRVRETHLGPVTTAFCFAQPGEEVALRRVPVSELDRETIQATWGMMRAKSIQDFTEAITNWRFPSVNLLVGDAEGNIAYWALAAIPVRSRHSDITGGTAHPGTESQYDWQGFIPYELLPHVINPQQGFLYSGNHRPIESWYAIPFGVMTGSGGDTVRSRRLRERLESQAKFSPDEVLQIHYDSQNPARRDLVRLGLHLRDTLERPLSPEATQTLEILADWFAKGASSDLTQPGAELATEINTFFRFIYTDLAFIYGGGESGLSYFLKTLIGRLENDPKADISPLEQDYIDRVLADAWLSCQNKYGRLPSEWNARARRAVTQQQLGYFVSLDGFPSLDPKQDMPFPALTIVDGGTIQSQSSQSYTQWVPLHAPDTALSLLPVGPSERPDSLYRTSNLEAWERGTLHPAPLSREAVEQLAEAHVILQP